MNDLNKHLDVCLSNQIISEDLVQARKFPFDSSVIESEIFPSKYQCDFQFDPEDDFPLPKMGYFSQGLSSQNPTNQEVEWNRQNYWMNYSPESHLLFRGKNNPNVNNFQNRVIHYLDGHVSQVAPNPTPDLEITTEIEIVPK